MSNQVAVAAAAAAAAAAAFLLLQKHVVPVERDKPCEVCLPHLALVRTRESERESESECECERERENENENESERERERERERGRERERERWLAHLSDICLVTLLLHLCIFSFALLLTHVQDALMCIKCEQLPVAA